MRARTLIGAAVWMLACLWTPAHAAELVQLNADTWDAFAPEGKEVDGIYGDIVIRNDRLTAVIAQPTAGRNANITVRNVGGAVIDFTRRDLVHDQLSAFYPGAAVFPLRQLDAPPDRPIQAARVQYRCRARAAQDRPQVTVTYVLEDGWDYLLVVSDFVNPRAMPIEFDLMDSVRADTGFEMGLADEGSYYWCHDPWWRQAYAVLPGEHRFIPVGDSLARGRPVLGYMTADGNTQLRLEPRESFRLSRRLLAADNHLQLRGMIEQVQGVATHDVQLQFADADGPIALSELVVHHQGQVWAIGRTDDQGKLRFSLPRGTYELQGKAVGRAEVRQTLRLQSDSDVTLQFERPGYVVGQITDQQGQRIACKVEFRSRDGQDPYLGPDTFVYQVRNLRYTPDGTFRQDLDPGVYDVIISHGPEYDAIFRQIEVQRGADTLLAAQLVRTVDTTGWVSSDFHSHSSPSGDNTASQLGRVLNLLSEHIEFAPCTEHNRIMTYDEHLEVLDAVDRMATCPGMELTGSPLPVNHQNAFPLIYHPRQQDGGGPQTDPDPIIQIERLAMWDRGSEKVVQGNHPNIVQILGDRDLDGQPDGGFRPMLGFMDVIEVHPPHTIFTPPTPGEPPRGRGNVIFNWMQLLNLGYRIPGVVNTDAHYNFHGSGWLRNYIKSATDDPAEIQVADMVGAAQQGQMVMTNGPFLEVVARSASAEVGPGQDLAAEDSQVELEIRVQCANWLDINRVQVFANGRPREDANFTRRTHPDLFGEGVVKFHHLFTLPLERDTHLIVATAGEGLQLGPVVGPAHAENMPVAVSNPIFVDVDGQGFQPSGDLLDFPLPIATSP